MTALRAAAVVLFVAAASIFVLALRRRRGSLPAGLLASFCAAVIRAGCDVDQSIDVRADGSASVRAVVVRMPLDQTLRMREIPNWDAYESSLVEQLGSSGAAVSHFSQGLDDVIVVSRSFTGNNTASPEADALKITVDRWGWHTTYRVAVTVDPAWLFPDAGSGYASAVKEAVANSTWRVRISVAGEPFSVSGAPRISSLADGRTALEWDLPLTARTTITAATQALDTADPLLAAEWSARSEVRGARLPRNRSACLGCVGHVMEAECTPCDIGLGTSASPRSRTSCSSAAPTPRFRQAAMLAAAASGCFLVLGQFRQLSFHR